jgi:tRNA pseudouridine55 synthase
MHGAIVVDKPEGLTSHDVVAAVRRLLPRGTKAGHTGTLDPFATGVLPVLVGKATRLARFLSGDDKRYRATVAFGTSTTTCDRTGDVVDVADATRRQMLTPAAVAETLAGFVGTHPQQPPVYSAKKVDGERAYERARRGDTSPLPPVMVTAHALHLDDFDVATGHAVIDVWCGAGYYVRALARDLGARLGVPAHLHALRRTAAGPFGEDDAVPLDTIVRSGPGGIERHVRPMSTLLPRVPAVDIDDAGRARIRHGQFVEVAAAAIGLASADAWSTVGHVCLMDTSGHLLALARPTPTAAEGRVRLQPDVVVMPET